MKKIFFIISFFSIFFIFTTQASAACSWEVLTTVSTPSNMGGGTSVTGGCKAKNLTVSDSAKCISPKPSYSSSFGQSLECCCSAPVAAAAEKAPIFTMPDLQVQIPGLAKLADINCPATGDCSIPWLGQYISGLYNYALAIVGIIAAIVLMGGGLMWLVSGGDASRITQAKDLIIGSITGLVILASSYIILLQINPNLVNLTSIAVTNIKKITIYPDADITVVGGARAYADGCAAAKKGDLTVCTAYGNAQPEGLVSIENVKVNASVAQRYTAAMECVNKKNGKYLFYINEAWRSAAKQIEYKKKYPDKSATPCCSNHGAGQAMDINRLDGISMNWDYDTISGLKDCMNAQQLYANITTGGTDGKGEPWHWSPTGH